MELLLGLTGQLLCALVQPPSGGRSLRHMAAFPSGTMFGAAPPGIGRSCDT